MRRCFVALIWLLVPSIAAAQQTAASSAAGINAEFVVGDGYIVRAERHGVRQQFKGDLVKATERWIVLRCVTGGRGDDVPLVSAIPLVGRMFQGPAHERTDETIWIPRDAVIVERRAPAVNGPIGAPPASDDPPTHLACAVQLVVGNKSATHTGGMESIKGDKLILSVPSQVAVPRPTNALAAITRPRNAKPYETRYNREVLNRHDILCVRVANFDPAAFQQSSR